MGVPRNHPFIDGFSRKSTIHLGIPPFISFMKTPSWHPWEDFACPCCIVYMVFFLVCRTPSFSCLICHVCWECILMLCCLSKNMLLGFVRHVFTCCIDKYQYMLLGNLIIDYLAWFVSAPHVFLCCNINNLMLQWPDVFFWELTPWVASSSDAHGDALGAVDGAIDVAIMISPQVASRMGIHENSRQ